MTTKTKKTETLPNFQEMIENWDSMTSEASEQLLEATQKSFDQALAMHERMVGMWLDNLQKLQNLSLKESEAAFKAAEAFQAQVKEVAERTSKMESK